jgi:hypothetical protein
LIPTEIPSSYIEPDKELNDSSELLGASIYLPNKKVSIHCLYRQPSQMSNDNAVNKFLQKLKPCMNTKNVIILGDFNLPGIEWSDCSSKNKHEQTFINELNNYGLKQLIKKPTRNHNILDLCLSNTTTIAECKVTQPFGALTSTSSDHKTILITLTTKKKTVGANSAIQFKKREYKKAQWYEMGSFLATINLESLMHNESITLGKWSLLKFTIQFLQEKFIPTRKNYSSLNMKENYLKLKECRLRKKCYNDQSYLKDRIAVSNQLRNLREGKYSAKTDAKNILNVNKQSLWKFIRERFHHRTTIPILEQIKTENSVLIIAETDKQKTKILNNFFLSFRQPIISKNKVNQSSETIKQKRDVVDDLDPNFTCENIIKIIKKIKSKQTEDSANMSSLIFKRLSYHLAPALSDLFSTSYKNSEIPQDWLHGWVTPIPKTNPPSTSPCNYRPVTIISNAAKIMEHILYQQMMQHVINNNLLSKRQYGFLKGRSVEAQLLSRLNDWIKAIDQGVPIDVIYLDIKRAYDSVSIRKLLRLLRKLKFPPLLIKWLESYLTIRTQTVRINGQESDIGKLTLGLPQGSVLSSLLFILYINDSEFAVKYSELYLFADDMVLYKRIQSIDDSKALQSDLTRLVSWATRKELEFNIKKSYVLHLSKKYNKYYNYKIGDNTLTITSIQRDLGVFIDSELNFKHHRNIIINKCFRMLGIINRNFRYHNKEFILTMYNAFVRPTLTYCSTVWNPINVTDILQLERVQRRVTARVHNDKDVCYENRLANLNYQPLYVQRAKLDVLMMGKILNKTIHCSEQLHEDLQSLKITNTRRRFSSRNKNEIYFVKNKYTTKQQESFLFTRSIDNWNSIDKFSTKNSLNYNSTQFSHLKKYFT